MDKAIAVGYADQALEDKAALLAKRLGLEVNNETLPRLVVTPQQLTFLAPGFAPLYVDFSQSNWQKRHQQGKKQGLVQACKPRRGLTIVDCTAGWGKDAAILASFGAQVLMIERQPVMAALLEDGLKRLSGHSPLSALLSLHQGDAITYFNQLTQDDYPDVVYIDPMHPSRQKSALVKKEMQALQHLIGPDEDVLTLLELAIQKARQQVVVKWPQRIKPLLPPTHSYNGKTVRFDVYKINAKQTKCSL